MLPHADAAIALCLNNGGWWVGGSEMVDDRSPPRVLRRVEAANSVDPLGALRRFIADGRRKLELGRWRADR
jgi:hypothetical protein